LSPFDIALDVPPEHGDLVIYSIRQSMRYAGALGIVIGTDDAGHHLVMWCRRDRMMFDIHEPWILKVLARGYVDDASPEEISEPRTMRAPKFFVEKRHI
jgi:hypothetical protein